MQRRLDSTTRTHDALVAFIESHAGSTYDGDVGPLFGQACAIRDHGIADDESTRLWVEAANAALSSEAMREVRSTRGHRRTAQPSTI